MKRIHLISASLPLLLFLSACSEAPKTAETKEPEKPAEPLSAQFAFQQMYIAARSWAPDAQPLRVINIDLEEVPSEGGKAGAWEATFVSPSRNRARRFTYSAVDVPNSHLYKRAMGGPEEGWSASGQVRPFPIQAFRTDATKAHEIAVGKGADYARKHPDMRMKYQLELTNRFPNPAWRVIWGESVSTSSYSIFVDASTGEYLQTVR